MYRRNYRSGFSLIELLIVVAIIAALIGVAVPYFQSNLSEAQVTKAKQDLDTVRNAINLYESRYRPLIGFDLNQILGQTMQEIPKDPWGAPYYLDANLGIIWTYGADGQTQGQAGDADQVFQYKPKIQIRKTEYEGAFGPTAPNNRLKIFFTKPFDPVGGVTATKAKIQLIRNISSSDEAKKAVNRIEFTNTAKLGTWDVDPLSTDDLAKKDGILILKCSAGPPTASAGQALTPTMAVDVTNDAYTVLKILPINPVITAAGAAITLPSSVVAGVVPRYYPGYPGEFGEVGAIPAENGLGARIERRQ